MGLNILENLQSHEFSNEPMSRRNFLKTLGCAGLMITGVIKPDEYEEDIKFETNVRDYEMAAKEIAGSNTKDEKIIPSLAYSDGEWTRDAVWTVLGLEDFNLGRELFKRIIKTQQQNGQIPTSRRDLGELEINDDESTQAYLLLSYFLYDRGYEFNQQEHNSIINSLNYCALHLDNYGYWKTMNKSGFQTWHDTIIFDKDDVPSYTQGVTAAAFEAGKRMFPDLEIYRSLAKKTQEKYIALSLTSKNDFGYLPLSGKKSQIVDVSSLFGEFLSLQLFQKSLLPDETVFNTQKSFRGIEKIGYKVVSNKDGSYLCQKDFVPDSLNPPGAYQNGGSWLAYDMAALLAVQFHGSEVKNLINDRLEAEFKYKKTLWEYIETNPQSPNYGKAPDNRTGYSWNIVFLPLLRKFVKRPEMQIFSKFNDRLY